MKNDLEILVEKVEAKYEADVLIYFGPVMRKWDDFLIDTFLPWGAKTETETERP